MPEILAPDSDIIQIPSSSPPVNPVTMMSPIPSRETYEDPDLSGLGYYIHKRGRFLVCASCHLAVLPGISSTHSVRHDVPKFSISKLTHYIETFHLFTDSEDFHAWALKQDPFYSFPKMPMMRGYVCSICGFAASTEKTIKAHCKQHNEPVEHETQIIQKSPAEYKAQIIQKIYLRSQFNKWIPVRPQEDTVPIDNIMEGYYAIKATMPPREYAQLDVREIPPWLKKFGWLEILQDLDPIDMTAFLRDAKDAESFQTLCVQLVKYAERSMTFLKRVPTYISQALGSPTLEVRGRCAFTAPDSDDTIAHYTSLVAHLIVTQRDLQILDYAPTKSLLNPTQDQSINALFHAITHGDSSAKLLPLIHDVLMKLFIHEFLPNQCDIQDDPVFMWIIWHNWTKSGSFKKPNDITKDFAALSWMARCTVLTDVYLVKQGSNGTIDYKTCLNNLRPCIIQGASSPLGHIYGHYMLWGLNVTLQNRRRASKIGINIA